MKTPRHALTTAGAALLIGLLCVGCASRETRPLLAYIAAQGGTEQVYLYSFEDGSVERLTAEPGSKAHPAFSVDGRRIFYSSDLNGDWDIYAVEIRSGEVEKLTWSLVDEVFPSPTTWDGGFTYLARGDGGATLWAINEPGDSPPLLLNNELYGEILDVRWDRRGSWLALVLDGASDRGLTPSAHGDLWSYNHRALVFQPLLVDEADNIQPSWSRDARWLVFSSNRAADGSPSPTDGYDIFLLEMDGGALTRLTDLPGDAHWPLVERDNESLIFYGRLDGVSGILRRVATAAGPRYELLLPLDGPPLGMALYP